MMTLMVPDPSKDSCKKVRNPKGRFASVIQHNIDWLNDPLIEAMIEDVDSSKHINDYIIHSPVLGYIPPDKLSGGVKGLILVYKDQEIVRTFSSVMFGENCIPWLIKLSYLVDFTLVMDHPMMWYASAGYVAEDINAMRDDGTILPTTYDVAQYYVTKYYEYYKEEE